LPGGQVGVTAFRLEFWIGMRVRLDDGTNVLRPSGVFLFPARSATSGKVLHAADALPQLLQALADGLASPAEAAFGLAGIAVAQGKCNFSQEEAALVAAQPPGCGLQHGVVTLAESFHDGFSGITAGLTLPGSCPGLPHYEPATR